MGKSRLQALPTSPRGGNDTLSGLTDDNLSGPHGDRSPHSKSSPCPVTSRINPCASIQARFRWMEARLTPIRVSTIGAETSGHSISVARKTGGVLPER